MTLQTFDDGRVLADVEPGDGSWCVFLHGWGRNRTDFESIARTVRSTGTGTAVIDLPGFGASPPPQNPCGTGDYADVLVRAVTELVGGAPNDATVTIVGHSFGGRVAVQVGARQPPWLTSLVLIGTPLLRRPASRTGGPPMRYRLVRTLARIRLLSEATLERARQRYGSADYRAATGVMREVLVRTVNEDYAELLPRIQVPTWLVWGRNDTAAPLAVAQEASGMLPHLAQLHVVDDAAHDVHRSAPGEVTEAIDRAIAGEEPA